MLEAGVEKGTEVEYLILNGNIIISASQNCHFCFKLGHSAWGAATLTPCAAVTTRTSRQTQVWSPTTRALPPGQHSCALHPAATPNTQPRFQLAATSILRYRKSLQ